MTFLQPWMLWGLLGASVPIIIHLIHRRRPRRQPFAAIELLLKSADRVDKRWRLQRILLLASRVLLLALLALAAARPTPAVEGQPAAAAGPRRVGIVVDASASMRARYDDRAAFERAVRQARALVDDLGPEDLAVVVRAGPESALATPEPTADRRGLLRSLDDLQPSYGRGDLGRAATLAVRALDPGEEIADVPVEVVVLSDWASSAVQTPADVSLQAGGRARVELVDVLADVDEGARDNLALTSVQTEPALGAPMALRFSVRTRSFAEQGGPVEPTALDVVMDGEPLETTMVEVAPGTISDRTVEHTFDGPGTKQIELRTAPDRLPVDDRFFVVARVRPQIRTLVVDGDPSGVAKEDEVFYFDKAARTGLADHPVPRVVTADELPGVDLSAFDVVVLAGLVTLPSPEGGRLSQFVEDGGGLLVAVGEATDAEALSAALPALPRALRGIKMLGDVAGSSGPLGLEPPDLDHPIFEVFRGEGLGGLESTRTWGVALLEPGTGASMAVPLRYESGAPAMVTASAGRGRVALWTSSLDRDLTDFPIRPAFLPWVRRTVLWLGRGLHESDDRPALVGETHPIPVSRDATFVRVRGPSGDDVSVPVTGGVAAFEGADQPGHYRVFTAEGAPLEEAHFAANVDVAESDLRPMRLEEAEAILVGGASGAARATTIRELTLDDGWSSERWVTLLLALMAATFLFESLLTTRRIGRAN